MRKLLHLEDTLNSLYQVIGHVEKFQGVDSEKNVDSSLELVNNSVAGKCVFPLCFSLCFIYFCLLLNYRVQVHHSGNLGKCNFFVDSLRNGVARVCCCCRYGSVPP